MTLIATVSLPSPSSLLKLPNKRVKPCSVQFRNAQYVWCILMLPCVAGRGEIKNAINTMVTTASSSDDLRSPNNFFYSDRRDFKPPVFTDSAVVFILPNFGMNLNRTVEF